MKRNCFVMLCLVWGLGVSAQSVTKITKTIEPLTTNLPVVKQSDVQGGYQQVADITSRDGISTSLKTTGMLVWVQSANSCYQWNGTAWIQVSLIKTWATGATFAVGDVFLYNNSLVTAIAAGAGTIAAGDNPLTLPLVWSSNSSIKTWVTGAVFAIGDKFLYNNSIVTALAAGTIAAGDNPFQLPAVWSSSLMVNVWATGAAFAVGDLFLYNQTLVQAKTAGTIAAAANPITDFTNWSIVGDNLSLTTVSNHSSSYTVLTATVDSYSGIVIQQDMAGSDVTVEPPTNTIPRRFTVVNSSTSMASLLIGTYTIEKGCSVELVWDGSAWTLPSTRVPFSGLNPAIKSNFIDNLNLDQTWNWSTADAQNALTINADALTTGAGLALASASTGATGNLFAVTSASTSAFTNGGVRLKFSGAHGGNGLQIDDASQSGNVAFINAPNLTTGNALGINADALTSGTGLTIASGSTSATGSLLAVNSGSTSAFGNGGVRFGFSAHTGSGLLLDDATLTGTAAKINANHLTTGSGLSITSTSTANTSTAGLLNVANTTATTTGTILRAQANSTAGSGLTVLASGNTGLGIAAPVATLHNAGSTVLGMTTASNAASTYTIPTASVNGYSGVVITQSGPLTAALTVNSPTDATAGRTFTVANAAASTKPLTYGTYSIPAGSAAQLVWDGGAWSAPSATASTVPFSGLTAATATNTLDNKNLAQTWNWTIADTQNPLTINANALTTGSALSINANALTAGSALSLASTSTSATNPILNFSSASTSFFGNGGARFNFTGAHTGTGLNVSDLTQTGTVAKILAPQLTTGFGLTIDLAALTGGVGLYINSTSPSFSSGTLVNLVSSDAGATGQLMSATSASTGLFSNGAVNFRFTGAHTGNGLQLDDVTLTGTAAQINANALTTGTGLGIAANALTTGSALSLASTATGTTGNLLAVTSASTSAFANGGARLNFTGAHTGNGLQLDDVTLTGTAAQINANALTTGTGLGIAVNALTTGSALSITSSSTANTSANGLLYVANTSASTTGTVATIQSNSTAGSGITVLANGFIGVGNASPTVMLDVTGDAKVNGKLLSPSDIRLKTKVETLTNVLSKLEQMRGVSYEFINQTKYAKGPQVGVIAQELQKVFPELVMTGSDGFLSVNYTQLTAVLIQAVKEQQTEINELKEQMKRVMEKLNL